MTQEKPPPMKTKQTKPKQFSQKSDIFSLFSNSGSKTVVGDPLEVGPGP